MSFFDRFGFSASNDGKKAAVTESEKAAASDCSATNADVDGSAGNQPNLPSVQLQELWKSFGEAFSAAMKTDEVSMDILTMDMVIKWVRSHLPKGCRKAVMIYSNPDWISDDNKRRKMHFCAVFCDAEMNIIEDSLWGYFHADGIDDALKANFGANDMIVFA